jgi:predicted nucleic acid-binding protein
MIIVSNTSPITNLSAIGKLDILQQLYSKIIITPEVFEELTQWGDAIPGAKEVKIANWIEVQSANNISLIESLQNELDTGESSAIALALELNADWLIIDEQLGRQVAIDSNLRITGILGILIEAKRQGLIPLVKPILDDLINIASFWVNPSLYNRILAMVRE